MIAVIEKNVFLNAVNTVSRAVSSKTPMTILECILIETFEDRIKFSANDSELGIETTITEKCRVEETGRTAVEARIFSDIIKKIEDGDIKIKTNGSIMQINSESSEFKIQERDPDQFPALPSIGGENCVSIPQFTLKELIRDTLFSVAANDSNKMMTGEYFEINGNTIKVTSLDGHRISIRKAVLSEEYEKQKAIIPGKALNEISKLLSDNIDDYAYMFFESNNILFRLGGTVLSSRLIDGEYFRIDSMLSNDYDTKVTVNKKDFIEYVERAVILIRETDKKPLVMNITDGVMSLKINTFLASYNSSLLINKSGKDLMIGFNPRFILDALKAVDDEEVSMYMTNPKAPCFIRNEENTYIYLILPINFNPAAYEN